VRHFEEFGINRYKIIIMPNNYYQITIQLIFAVKNREALIENSFRERLHRYINGVVKKQGQKLLCINSVPDHIHILIGLSPEMRISDLIREIKSESSLFINRERLSQRKFYWQAGAGIFSYSKSQRPVLVNYIKNQQVHHKKTSFRNEYQYILDQYDIDFNQRYLFDFFD
jgi:REP element-mobilizing transposase RayT